MWSGFRDLLQDNKLYRIKGTVQYRKISIQVIRIIKKCEAILSHYTSRNSSFDCFQSWISVLANNQNYNIN